MKFDWMKKKKYLCGEGDVIYHTTTKREREWLLPLV